MQDIAWRFHNDGSLNNAMKVEGTPLNDKFYAFMTQRDSLMFLLQELPRKESTMILDGYDHDEILRELGEEEGGLRMAIDKLETDFVTANFDNVRLDLFPGALRQCL